MLGSCAVGLGVLLICLAGPWRREFLAPGALSQPHAQILSGQLRNDRCAACHPAARGDLAAWFGTGGSGHANVTQVDLCVDCHHAVVAPQRARWAHNLSTAELQQVATRWRENRAGRVPGPAEVSWHDLLPAPEFAADAVACAACHREHGGSQATLSQLSDTQCQSCHADRFASFADGHPEFGAWPHGRAGGIRFNHVSHGDHFVKAGRGFRCRDCHPADSRGELDRVVSYESNCAYCHDQALRTRTQGGFTLVELPMLDVEALEAAQQSPGAWPDLARGVDAIRLPPLMRGLLEANPRLAAEIDRLEHPEEDVWSEPPTAGRLRAMAALAEATRRLIAELAAGPVARLRQAWGSPHAEPFAAGLSPQLIAAARQRWFEGASSAAEPIDPAAALPLGGWYLDDLAGAIRYRGSGHADPVLAALCELIGDERLPERERAALRQIPAVQACFECHVTPQANRQSSWRAASEDAGRRGFTKFSHRPHLNLPQLSDCTHCHRVNAPDTEPAAVELSATAPAAGSRPEFQRLERSSCVSCHTRRAAGDSCLQCHRYHVDPLPAESAVAPHAAAQTATEPDATRTLKHR
jgi:hypothetical protein